jgi:flagellin
VSGRQIYRKDLQTGAIELVSRSTNGTPGSAFHTIPYLSISGDGSKVLFESTSSNLVSGDTNGVADIFIRDLSKTGVNELAGVVVSNQASASVTLGMMRDRIKAVSLVQSGIGASISRIGFATSNLNSTTEAFATAKSQIMDTDIAEESSKLVSNQILQQAGVAVLAQANAQTELILTLLKFRES